MYIIFLAHHIYLNTTYLNYLIINSYYSHNTLFLFYVIPLISITFFYFIISITSSINHLSPISIISPLIIITILNYSSIILTLSISLKSLYSTIINLNTPYTLLTTINTITPFTYTFINIPPLTSLTHSLIIPSTPISLYYTSTLYSISHSYNSISTPNTTINSYSHSISIYITLIYYYSTPSNIISHFISNLISPNIMYSLYPYSITPSPITLLSPSITTLYTLTHSSHPISPLYSL